MVLDKRFQPTVTVPGHTVSHKIISLACRATHGVDMAMKMAIQDVETKYKELMREDAEHHPNHKATYHLVLTVDRDV